MKAQMPQKQIPMPPSPVPAKIWPIIEVSKCEDIPCDYPGPMGVPVTFLSKIGGRNDGGSGFLIIDFVKPKCRGKDMYQRLVIVNTRFCSGLFQVYKKADGNYCTAEKLPASAGPVETRGPGAEEGR